MSKITDFPRRESLTRKYKYTKTNSRNTRFSSTKKAPLTPFDESEAFNLKEFHICSCCDEGSDRYISLVDSYGVSLDILGADVLDL